MIPYNTSRAKIVWSPTVYSHDPNPPMPLEDVPTPPPAAKPLAALGVGD